MDPLRPKALPDVQALLERLEEEIRALRAAHETTEGGRQLLRQGEEFSRILAVSKLVVSELDLARVQELVAEQARELVGAETVLVPILNEARDGYTYAAAVGLDADAVRGATFAAHVGMCGWVLQHQRSLLFGEASAHWMEEQTPWEEGQQSAVLVPLMGRQGIIGGLSALGKQGGGCFTQHDLDLLTMFASHVSSAIENARLFREVTREIGERRQAEQAVRENQAMLRQVLDTMPHSVFWKDRESVYRGCNHVFARAVGHASPEEIAGKTDFDLPWPRAEAEAYRRDDLEVIASDRAKLHIIEPLQQADGSRLWIETSKAPLHDAQGAVIGVLGVYEDITGRREAEERLRESERFVREILDNVDEGLIVVDREYRVRVANRAFAERFSGGAPRIIGEPCYTLAHRACRPCLEDGEECPVRMAFDDGRSHAVRHKHPDAERGVIFVEVKAFPLKDAEGRVTSAIEVVADVTERHLLEEERLRTQKLEAVGTLAGGIAHDFNNLLQAVLGNVSLARLELDDQETARAALADAETALRMSVKLTNQLLTFSKGGKPTKKVLDPLPLVENAARFTLSGSRNGCRVTGSPGLWPVAADEGQVYQVIQNIVLNADQAMPSGGQVEIALRNVEAPGPETPQALREGRYVAISIRDTGMGIAEEHLPRIFDPYFTTKARGNGLGLATSYSIVKQHGGAIDAASERGVGTTFTVFLPAAAKAGGGAAVSGGTTAPPGRVGRVLVMDDEPAIRGVASALLRRLGHRVEVAEHGAAAVELYRGARQAGDPFDLVILDLTVRGGMGGAETLRRLLEIDPGVRAIVSSGYSDDAEIAGHEERGFKAFLKKPYDVAALREVLDRVLPPPPSRP